MAVTLTIEDPRHEDFEGPEVTNIPDGARVLVRRCATGADVLVLPGTDSSLPPKTIVPAGEPHRVTTWGVLARDDDRSFVLRLQDGHGRDHDFIVSTIDLAGIGTASLGMAGHEVPYEAARVRKMAAEAQLVEMEVAERRRAARSNDRQVQAGRLSVESNADLKLAAVCATDLSGGPELRIEIAADRIVWLAEQLLAAKRRIDGAES